MTDFIFTVHLENGDRLQRTITIEKGPVSDDQKGNFVNQVCGTACTAGWLQPAEDYKTFVHYPPKMIDSITVEVVEHSVLLATGQQVANLNAQKLVAA